MINRMFPEARKRAARRLRGSGWKQVDIAAALGVTQAMVSRYLSSDTEIISPGLERDIDKMAADMVSMIESQRGDAEIISAICSACFAVRERGALCSVHPVENCRVCMNIRSQGPVGKRKDVLDDVRAAVSVLEGRMPAEIIPEVRMNIASALPDAKMPAGVVAIPGRLVEIKGEIKALTEPEFGASSHLSRILLSAREGRSEIIGVVNTLFNDAVERALKKLRIGFTEFDGENIPPGWKGRCLVYRGGYGREPCLYVFGASAKEAAETVRRISLAVLEGG